MQHSKLSRPGPSYWKIAFQVFFPDLAQEAYWDFIDTQRACGIVAAASKMAVQVHLNKPFGGVRPLTMLEESFNAIEGPVARRKTEARRSWPDGTVYQPFNLAGEAAKRATYDLLYIDALIQTSSCEAVEECMGVQIKATGVTAEAFSCISIVIETKWGLTTLIVPNRVLSKDRSLARSKQSPRNPPY